MIAFYILLIYGFLCIVGGFYQAYKHGEPKGDYNGIEGVIGTLIGVMFILIAMGVIK